MTAICNICKKDKEFWVNDNIYKFFYNPDTPWICKDCYVGREEELKKQHRLEWEQLDKECPLSVIEDGIELGCDKMKGNKDIEKLRKHITQKHTKTQMVDFIIENFRLWEDLV